jgi:hypothetical protein
MADNKGLLGRGWSKVKHNKRYIFWFWLMNLALGMIGASVFKGQAHTILGNNLYADRLVHGFDISVLVEMFARPEFGPTSGAFEAGFHSAIIFFLATAIFLPGVFQGYASNYRLPRDEFFRACGRNLWRFIRLLIIAGIVMGVVAGALFALHGFLEGRAEESTNEMLLPWVRGIGLAVIFLAMTTLRICFDLAEADVVLNDQQAVRHSAGIGFRHTFRNLGKLLGSYLITTIMALIILGTGLVVWLNWIPAKSTTRAFLLAQLILLLLLIPRFWQRGIAVAYWQEKIAVTLAPTIPVVAPVVPASPVIPITPVVEGV